MKAHGVLHRDIKLDNVLLQHPDTDREVALLTDFGMSFDLHKNRVRNFTVQLRYDGFRRGGAPMSMAPEIILPRPGPDTTLNYEKSDEWSVGILLHQLLSPRGQNAYREMMSSCTSRHEFDFIKK